MPRSGLAFGGALEEGLCALRWGYTVEDWEELDTQRKAYCLAVYRCEIQMNAVVDEYRKP